MKLPIALLNTTIATTDGIYSIQAISLDSAIKLVRNGDIDSAIGHDATAKMMSEMLGVNVAVNRQQFSQQPLQKAVVFKLKGRAPEGAILSREEVEKIGYEFKLMVRLS